MILPGGSRPLEVPRSSSVVTPHQAKPPKKTCGGGVVREDEGGKEIEEIKEVAVTLIQRESA